MPCPAVPLDGLSDEMTGGPPGATTTVVEVVVELDVDPLLPPAPLFPPPVDEGCDDGVRDCVGPATVEGVGAGLPLRETARATAAITTRTATTATDPTSQRSGRAGGRPFWRGGAASTGAAATVGRGGGS